MKKLSRSRYAPWLTGAAAGLVTFSGGEKLAAAPVTHLGDLSLERQADLERYGFSYDHVLGTSLDLVIDAARPADAIRAAARKQGFEEREVYAVERGNAPWPEILASAQSMSLFASRKLIEIRIPGGDGREGRSRGGRKEPPRARPEAEARGDGPAPTDEA